MCGRRYGLGARPSAPDREAATPQLSLPLCAAVCDNPTLATIPEPEAALAS